MCYSHEWLLLCLLLHMRSSSTFNFLSNNKILPLPAKSTITQYLKASNSGVGFDDNFFDLFAKELAGLPEIARHGIISFDEMTCRKSREVDMKTMEFTGLANYGGVAGEDSKDMNDLADKALVFMFSSLSFNFHQPIGMFGAKGATNANVLAALLLQAIIKVEGAGGKVHAFVSDGASTNRSMWTEFGISGKIDADVPLKCCFPNPCDETRSIYAISDTPHLIKCVRNRLQEVDHLKTPDGYVFWWFYRKLYEMETSNGLLRMCPKLTSNHVYVSQQLKMRVYLATQVFSTAVSDALKYLKQSKNPDFIGCDATIKFTSFMNDLFDVLNRSNPYNALHLSENREPSMDFETIQEKIKYLDEWERSTTNKNEFLTRQTAEGLRVTLHSTYHLSRYLLLRCGFKYVLTRKMNQDRLEQFFGIVRQAAGANDHPTFCTFMQLYHLLSLFQILKPPKHGNCTVQPDSNSQKFSITLADFKKAFSATGKTFKEKHIQDLRNKLDNLIETATWDDSDLLFDMIEEFAECPDEHARIKDCIQYYLTGFVCRKFFKKVKCESCKEAFTSSHENLVHGMKESDFLMVKSKGGLFHPNIRLFNLFCRIEKYFEEFVNSSEVYSKVIEKLIDDNIIMTFPCEKHANEQLPELIHYYIQLRMLQTAKSFNREGKKESTELKKNARYKTT